MQEIDHMANPFPGLRPFESSETHLFFGRDGQSEELLRRLKRTRFLAVVGTSGSGKSSLVRAGLLPALQGGLMASAGSDWRIAILRPGGDPIGNLARALTPAVMGSRDEKSAGMQDVMAETTLRRSSLGLVELVSRARTKLDEDGQPLLPDYENLLVVVDQFEELFRFKQLIEEGNSKEDAAAFVKLLLEGAGQKPEKIYVVLTMRSDFLGDCSQFFELPEALNNGQYLIPRMTRDERREAISGPVAVGQGAISDPLVNQLLNDVGDNPDQLPILQHALMRTWDHWLARRRNGDPLDIPDYNAIGGMAEALSRHADEAYAELNDSQKVIAEKLFKGLTEKGTDNREIRRPMEVQEICELTAAEEAAVIAVIEVFRREGRSFLMPPPTDALTGVPVLLNRESLIDISHESLIRNWERLKKWTEEEEQSSRIYKRLAETATLHHVGEEALLMDPALQGTLDWREKNKPSAVWARRYHPEFETAIKYLDASVAARDAELLERRKRQRREVSYKRTRLVALILALSVLLSLASAVYAFRQGSLAERQRAIAEQKTAEALAQQSLARKQSQRADQQALRAETERTLAVRASDEADKQRKLAEEEKKKADQQRALAEQQTTLARASEVKAIAAKALADQLAEKNRQLLYPADINLAQQAYETGNIERGRELLAAHTSANGDKPAFEWYYLWHLLHPEKETLTAPGEGSLFAISTDNKTLALATATSVKIRNLESGETGVINLQDPNEKFYCSSIAISPNGRLLAVGNGWPNLMSLKLYDTVSQKEIDKKSVWGARILKVMFSPDGRQLIVRLFMVNKPMDNDLKQEDISSDIIMFDVSGLQAKGSLRATGTVRLSGTNWGPALSPDGQMLATVSPEGDVNTIRFWDATFGRPVGSIKGEGNDVAVMAFSPKGGLLTVAYEDKTVRLFHVESGKQVGEPRLQPDKIHALAYSPDNTMLAFGYDDGTIKLFDATAEKELATFKAYEGVVDIFSSVSGHLGVIDSLSFSADSKVLYSGGGKARAKAWMVKSWDVGAQIREQAQLLDLKGTGNHARVAFSPDGKVYAITGAGTVTVLDAKSDKMLRELSGHDGDIEDLAFSSDSRILATAGDDKTVRLWEVASGKELAKPFKHDENEDENEKVTSVAVSPDGKLLATGLSSGAVDVWDISSRKVIGSLPPATMEVFNSPPVPLSVSHIAFSPTGETLALNRITRIELWDRTLSKQLGVIEAREDAIGAMAFSPSGSILAVGYLFMNVGLFDAASTRKLADVKGNKGSVRILAYSSDGKRLAIGGDGGIKILDATALRELLTLDDAGGIQSVAFSPDGRKLVGVGGERLKVWRTASEEELAVKSKAH